MEKLQQYKTIRISQPALDCREECGVGGSFTLPDYCADIATVMTCIMTPHLQGRQWSGDRFIVDGTADVRILYLDEERCRVHSVEFTMPFDCECKSEYARDSVPVTVELTTRYVNWRVLNPRSIEIRGAVILDMFGNTFSEMNVLDVNSCDMEVKTYSAMVSSPMCSSEKILTVSEQLEFPQDHPAAELLLGGHCEAVVTECKLLFGKAIVKGNLCIHQLYASSVESGDTRCLDFVVPFSQIMDIEDCAENQTHSVIVSCLSDTERCLVGPDGELTILEVTAKLLVQLCVWQHETADLLLDAYHTKCPVTLQKDTFQHNAYTGYKMESIDLPVPVNLPSNEVAEVLDVWVLPTNVEVTSRGQSSTVLGTLSISVLYRDRDKHIGYYQNNEDFHFDVQSDADYIRSRVSVINMRYSVDGDKLLLQLRLQNVLTTYQSYDQHIIKSIDVKTDAPFVSSNASIMMYYANANDSVWDIGRNCHASYKCIIEENGLSNDRIEKSMLLMVPLA